jgi:hypothetical protein
METEDWKILSELNVYWGISIQFQYLPDSHSEREHWYFHFENPT